MVIHMANRSPGRQAAFVGLALVAAIMTFAPRARAQDGGIALGAAAPNARVYSLDGKPVDLASLIRPGPAVIEFWAAWCPNCKELEPALVAVQKKYGARVKFVTVAVAVNESAERVRRFAAKYRMRPVVVYDADGKASDAYSAPATSYIVVLDRNGRVVYTGVGGTQNMEAAIRKGL